MTDTTDEKDIKDAKVSSMDDWDDDEEVTGEFPEIGTIMQFSDYVDPQEKQIQKQRITELRRRAEERQDWKKITGEYDLDLDEAMEEA